ncbi:reverse transcriptase domain-containing protein [Enterobacter kobei]
MKPTWLHKFEVKENRWVYIPDAETHHLGQKIHTYIKHKWKSPLYMFHLREGGHVAAANYHIKKKYFSLIDISNFFGATSQSRVTRELGRLIPYVKAREIARLSTVKNLNGNGLKHVIPYVYPQSPILASLCFHQSFCGSTINTVSKSGHVSVSIFMDDILLSSDDLGQLENAFDIILEAIRRSGYTVNENKTQPPSLMVNVFNLELSQNSLRVTSKRIVEFLQAFISSKNPHERKGIASYVGSINTAQAKLFR